MSAFDPIFSVLRGALSLLIVLPVLIAVHEFGHYWVAKLFGMKVEAFAVMIGGIRKTKLDGFLPRPLAPASQVWFLGTLSFISLIVGIVSNSVPTVMAGLVLLGIATPLWVVTRLGALYHLKPGSALSTLGKTWLVALMLSLVATKGHGLELVQFLGLITMASLVATLIVYYNPVFHKSEDSPYGHGQIQVDRSVPVDSSIETDLEEAAMESVASGQRRIPVSFRPLWCRTDKHGTEFSLLCIPLGGFALIKGMHPKEDGSETKIKGGFYNSAPFARLCVLFAGPLFSILFGVAVLAVNTMINGQTVLEDKPVVGKLSKGGAAATAGLKVGDKFVAINGTPVSGFYDVIKLVRSSHETVDNKEVGKPLRLQIERDGRNLEFDVTPTVDKTPTPVLDAQLHLTDETAIQAKLGILPPTANVAVPFGTAVSEAASKPVQLVAGLAQTVAKPATIADNVGGPAAIAEDMTQASEQGVDVVINMAALLSISLGVMNLLPIVPLDGGQMVVALAEMLRGGRRLSIQLQSAISTVGAFLIFILIIGVVTLDIGRHAAK